MQTQDFTPVRVPEGGFGEESAAELASRLAYADRTAYRDATVRKRLLLAIENATGAPPSHLRDKGPVARAEAMIAQLRADRDKLRADNRELAIVVERYRNGAVKKKLLGCRERMGVAKSGMRKLAKLVHPDGKLAKQKLGKIDVDVLKLISQQVNPLIKLCDFPENPSALTEEQKVVQTASAREHLPETMPVGGSGARE